MRSAPVILLLILLAVAVFFAVNRTTEESHSYSFDFSLVSTEGETVSRQDFAGQVLIVDIWGTWCPPCRAGIPHFVELQDEYREEGLRIVGINYENGNREDALAAIEEFTSEIPINYPLLIGDEATKAQIPNFQGFPTTLFIDREGKVRLTLVGARPKQELEAAAKALLKAPWETTKDTKSTKRLKTGALPVSGD